MTCDGKNNETSLRDALGLSRNGTRELLSRDNPAVNKCIHDIRNMRCINDEMLQMIRLMSEDEKMEIIVVFNEMIQTLVEIVND